MVSELTHLCTAMTLTRVAASAALAASLAGTLRSKSCTSCNMASGLSGGLPLGHIGIGFYLLATLATFLPTSTPAAWALTSAAGAHAVLLSLLLKRRLLCTSCLLTAAGALIGAASTIALDPGHHVWALVAAPVAGVAMLCAIGIAAGAAMRRANQRVELLLADAVNERRSIASGKVRIIVLSKAGCQACVYFKQSVLPELETQFAGIIDVEHGIAQPGTPAPTLLILGNQSLSFIGAAPADAIAPSIRMAIEPKAQSMVQPGERAASPAEVATIAA